MNMSFIVYRGDNRLPDVIRREGFKPKTFRADRVMWAKGKIREIFSIDPAAWVQTHIGYNDPDVVSTDLDPKGQAFQRGDYVYKIEFSILPSTADYVRQGIKMPEPSYNPQTRQNFQPKPNAFWPTLIINRPLLDISTIIALQVRGRISSKEVDFFTIIPGENVVAWKKTDSDLNTDFTYYK